MKMLRTTTRTDGSVLHMDSSFTEAVDKAIELASATGRRKIVRRNPSSAFRWQVREIEELMSA